MSPSMHFILAALAHARQSAQHTVAQTYLLLPSLPEHGVRLNADALYCVNQHHGPIAQPCSCRHLAAEVYMARRVDQVDQVPCSKGEQAMSWRSNRLDAVAGLCRNSGESMGFIGISTAGVNSLMLSQDDNPSRLAGNRDVAQLAAPHLPFAAFSSSEQLRMPPGLRAAPGTWSSEMELLFMVMPRACSSAPRQLCAALANCLGWVLRVSLSQFLAASVLVVVNEPVFAASMEGLELSRASTCTQRRTWMALKRLMPAGSVLSRISVLCVCFPPPHRCWLTCSSSRLSKYRISPTSLGWMRPLAAIRWSLNVVLP